MAVLELMDQRAAYPQCHENDSDYSDCTECLSSCYCLLLTHRPIPTNERTMPMAVSAKCQLLMGAGLKQRSLPLLMTLLSTYQSPTTVKRNAIVLTMGTVKLSSG